MLTERSSVEHKHEIVGEKKKAVWQKAVEGIGMGAAGIVMFVLYLLFALASIVVPVVIIVWVLRAMEVI